MAERRKLMFNRPDPSDGVLPEGPGEETIIDKVMHKAGVFTGLDEQRGGDLGDFLAASGGLLPLGKLMKLLGRAQGMRREAGPAINLGDKMLREHVLGSQGTARMGEFAPVDHPGSVRPNLDPEEALKELELTGRKPSASRPTEPPAAPKPRRNILNDESGVIGELGEVSPHERNLQNIFHAEIDTGTKARGHVQRRVANQRVGDAYQELADRGLAASEPELAKLRAQTAGLKTAGIKPKPTGLDVGKRVDQVQEILQKLQETGYKPKAEDLARLTDIAGQIAPTIKDDIGTGQLMLKLRAALPYKDPLRVAMRDLSGFGGIGGAKRGRPGVIGTPGDGTLPKHKEVIPEFRYKSGIAADTLDDMPKANLEQFSDEMSLNPKTPSSNIRKDPAKFVGHLKSMDEDALLPIHEDSFTEPGMIDSLIQDLSNYFAGPDFDPFLKSEYERLNSQVGHNRRRGAEEATHSAEMQRLIDMVKGDMEHPQGPPTVPDFEKIGHSFNGLPQEDRVPFLNFLDVEGFPAIDFANQPPDIQDTLYKRFKRNNR